MSVKSVKKDVLSKLGLISDDQLEEILTDLDLKVTAEKRKKGDAVFNAISRHLSSEDMEDLDDEGLSIFLKVLTKLDEMLEENKNDLKSVENETAEKEEKEPKSTEDGEEEKAKKKPEPVKLGASAAAVTRIEYHRMKDFRIEGGTVNGTLSYRNVFFQMEKGLELGYSKTEVLNAVVKAMKPGVLRSYCESPENEVNYEELCDLLKVKSGAENATVMLTRLHNSFQGDEFAEDQGSELEVDFVLRMGTLRKTVMKLAKDEGVSLDEEMVSKSFRHALTVGIRRDVIRLQVISILNSNETISDRELLKKVNKIVSMDNENQKTKGHNADVNALYLDGNRRQYPQQQKQQQYLQRQQQRQYAQQQQQQQYLPQLTDQKDLPRLPPLRSDYDDKTDAMMHQLTMMNATMVEMADTRKKEMEEMRGQIKKLEQRMNSNGNGGNQNNSRRGNPVKCQNCKDQNVARCTHCVKCLEEGHKQDQCTKNS